MARPEIPLTQKFWKNPNKKLPNECWEWIGCKDKNGYGFITSKISRRAHRISYLLHFEDPKEMHVLHKFDNTSCVNPNHLFLGTHKDNMQDMKKKGRDRKVDSEKHHSAKLTKEQAIAIYLSTEKINDIAKKYKIRNSSVSKIKNKQSWKVIHKHGNMGDERSGPEDETSEGNIE